MKCTACHKRLRSDPEEVKDSGFVVRRKRCVQEKCYRIGEMQNKEVWKIDKRYKGEGYKILRRVS